MRTTGVRDGLAALYEQEATMSTEKNTSDAEQSIAMDPEEERAAATHATEATEPADEGVGALTDDEDREPDTPN